MRKTNEFCAVYAKRTSIKDVPKTILLVFFLFLLAVLDSTWFRFARVLGVVPCVLFVFCVCFSVEKRGIYPVIISIFCGLLQDICAMRTHFFDAFLYLYISAGCVWVSGKVFCRRKSLQVLCVALATVAYDVCVFFIQSVRFGGEIHALSAVRDAGIRAIYHAAIACLLFPIVAGVSKRRGALCEKTKEP